MASCVLDDVALLSSIDLARWPFPSLEKMWELFLAELPDQHNYKKIQDFNFGPKSFAILNG